jgi:hypothetical protein
VESLLDNEPQESLLPICAQERITGKNSLECIENGLLLSRQVSQFAHFQNQNLLYASRGSMMLSREVHPKITPDS